MTDIFQTASRTKTRFSSAKGNLSTEQLWDLPLISANPDAVTLDSVAREVNRDLIAVSEEGFVEVKQNTATDTLTLKLDVVKAIIAVKVAEREDAAQAYKKAQQKAELLELLDQKDQEARKGLSREELQKQLAELG